MVRLKKKKNVEYKSFKKDEAFHIEMDIEGKRLDVIAWHYPAEKQVETKGEFGASPYSVKAKGERRREERGDWDAVIVTPDYGYLPLETWKRVRDSVSGTISVATGSTVLPSSVNLSGSMSISTTTKCPNCGAPIFYIESIEPSYCSSCGHKLN